ncbi:hypothetical protein PR048_029817 [Dryococelus australis]|uniref:RRM domain-containing protein n=1 Tax=Dryococelus australis TaxID=614101 RepID=A0ABQ9G9V4_9NEOP|nr:hypothetical protein PR048_029817 [Dryococelus australis]
MASIYVADLDPCVDEAMLFKKFSDVGPITSIRICRDKRTNTSLGYGYVNFQRQADAETALEKYNFDVVHGRPIRIMWTKYSSNFVKPDGGNIFVKNLSKDVDNKKFREIFLSFGNIVSCKICYDGMGNSKGYGYVQFEKEELATDAIEKLNGMLINGKEIYVGKFIPREKRKKERVTNNIYIKNLPDSFENAVDLMSKLFENYGSIISCKVVVDDDQKYRGFGFVSFKNPQDASRAVEELDGFLLAEGKRLYVAPAQKKTERQQMLKQKYEDLKSKRATLFRGRNLYLKNLDQSVDDECLLREFSAFGTVLSAKVSMDGSRSKGFGFVCFSTVEEAAKAIAEMNGRVFKTKCIYVSLAQTKEERKVYLEEIYLRRQEEDPPCGNKEAVEKQHGAIDDNTYFHCQLESSTDTYKRRQAVVSTENFWNHCEDETNTLEEFSQSHGEAHDQVWEKCSPTKELQTPEAVIFASESTSIAKATQAVGKIEASAACPVAGHGAEITGSGQIQFGLLQNIMDKQTDTKNVSHGENSCTNLLVLLKDQDRGFNKELTERKIITSTAVETENNGSVEVQQLPRNQTDVVNKMLLPVVRDLYPKAADKIIDFIGETDTSALQHVIQDRKKLEKIVVRLVTLLEIHDYTEALKKELLRNFFTSETKHSGD